MVGYQTPEQAAPERARQQEQGPSVDGDAQTLYGNQVAQGGLSGTDAPPTDGVAVPPELAARVDAQLAAATDCVRGTQGVAAQLPACWWDEAAWLLGYVPDLVTMLQEDRAALAHADPAEQNLLVELEADCAELTDRLLELDALRDLGEAIHRLRMLGLVVSGAAVAIPVATLAPRLLDQLALARQVAEARAELRAAALDAGEATLQAFAQAGLAVLLEAATVEAGPLAPLVDKLGDLASDRLDDALGADPTVLPGAALKWADRVSEELGVYAEFDATLKGATEVGDSVVLDGLDQVSKVLDPAGEGLDAGLRVAAAVASLRALAPRMIEARAAFDETRSLIAPLVAEFQRGMADTVAAAGLDVADAAACAVATFGA